MTSLTPPSGCGRDRGFVRTAHTFGVRLRARAPTHAWRPGGVATAPNHSASCTGLCSQQPVVFRPEFVRLPPQVPLEPEKVSPATRNKQRSGLGYGQDEPEIESPRCHYGEG